MRQHETGGALHGDPVERMSTAGGPGPGRNEHSLAGSRSESQLLSPGRNGPH